MYQQFKKYEKFQKKVLTFRGRGDMIINVAGSCGRDARKKFERTKTFQKKLKKFFGPLGKHKSRPSENGKAALRLNDLLVHIYIVYCGQAYGRRARAMTNGSNRSKEIISRLGLSSRTFCFITNYGQFRRKRG